MNSVQTNSTVDVNGITVAYDEAGTGELPIIFIHGFPFDKSSWKPQVDFLQKQHRVIAYDIRGFGGTDTDSAKPSMDLYANDLIDFMDILAIKKAVICGLSMGGYIVLNAVNRYADRIEAIILSDTQCISDSAEAKEKRYKSIAQITADGVEGFAEAFVKNAFCKHSLTHNATTVAEAKKIILATNPETLVGALIALSERTEMCNTLPKISVPALIVCGDEDALTPVAQSEFLREQIPLATFKRIPDAGHLSNLEQPDVFNQHVQDFISRLKRLN
jgi:pimeloyl-ACP methyl ester carboxylesterase